MCTVAASALALERVFASSSEIWGCVRMYFRGPAAASNNSRELTASAQRCSSLASLDLIESQSRSFRTTNEARRRPPSSRPPPPRPRRLRSSRRHWLHCLRSGGGCSGWQRFVSSIGNMDVLLSYRLMNIRQFHILFHSAKTWHLIVCWFLCFPRIYLNWT